jgi:hypothetical protein
MATPALLRGLLELSTCETVDALLDAALSLLGRELGVRGRIELWDGEDTRVERGEPADHPAAHRTWIGIEYTLGTIELCAPPAVPDEIELLAQQLAPLAERLMEREASQRRTIRDDVERLYERRIRDALGRHDWNFSAVARELVVSRNRVAEVARRWRMRSRLGSTRSAMDATRVGASGHRDTRNVIGCLP